MNWKIIVAIWFTIGLIVNIFSSGSSSNDSGNQARNDEYNIKKVIGAEDTSIKVDVGNLNTHESKSSIDGYNGISD